MRKRPYRPVSLRHPWLVTAATIPQLLAFYVPGKRKAITSSLAATVLVCSQILLLTFAAMNWKRPGMRLAGTGLGLNLAVILANGGLMPISPQTVRRLWSQATEGAVKSGTHLSGTKDLVLNEESTRLRWLSDRFVTPRINKIRYAFSFGDVVIALGVIHLLWTQGDSK